MRKRLDKSNRLVLGVAIACVVAVLSVDASAQTPTADALDNRLKSVHSLIEGSTAARQIDASDNAGAKSKREEARNLYRQAMALRQGGNLAEADKVLNQAAKTMFEGVRLAENAGLVDKKQQDFKGRMDSVTALVTAYGRICQEKRCDQPTEQELRRSVGTKVEAAKAELARDPDQARALLDEAYISAKAAIEHVRGGDTLVRSLQFKNKEEEYHYELDRNETHQLLLKVLLQDKLKDPAVAKLTQPLIESAGRLRKQAEQEASRGMYDRAIATLESSTRELQRALRSAGVYIPG